LNLTEEPGQEDKLVVRLFEEAVKAVFDQAFDPKQFRPVVEYFEAGKPIELGDHLSSPEAWSQIEQIRGFPKLVEQAAQKLQPELLAGPAHRGWLVSIAEFILEGLYCHNRLNKKSTTGKSKYGS
jgi:magnesium chelatase subunit I